MKNNQNPFVTSSTAGINSIAAQMLAKFGGILALDEAGEVTTKEVSVAEGENLVTRLRDLLPQEETAKKLFPRAVRPVHSREPEWIEVTDPSGRIHSMPVFNKTATNSVDGDTNLVIREIKLPPYIGHLEKGRYDLALVSLYRELVFQLRTELGLRVQGFFCPVAVSAQIPAGYYKFLYDSKGKVSRILVNEEEMKSQAVDSDGDRAFVLTVKGGDGSRVIFGKIPFTSQAPVLQKFEGPVFEDFDNLTLEDLPEQFPNHIKPNVYQLEAEDKSVKSDRPVMSIRDQFIKNHTGAPVGIITTEWNAAEAQYFLEHGYLEGCAMAFNTQCEVDGVMVNGRFQDVEGNGLKLSRKDGATKVPFCYASLNYQVYGPLAKCLMSSKSGIQSLRPTQMQHLRYASVSDVVARYWFVEGLTQKPDKWQQSDLVARPLTMAERAMNVIKEQGSVVKAIEVLKKTLKKDQPYGWRLLSEVFAINNQPELAERYANKADLIEKSNREKGWNAEGCFRDGGLITRLIKAKLLRTKNLGLHHSGLPMYQVELFDLQGNAVALFDQKREGNDLPEKGIGYHYLLVPVYDPTLGRWVDGLQAMRHAFRQEQRWVTVTTQDESFDVEEVRSFSRYFFGVRNPETNQVVRGFGTLIKDWSNRLVMAQLQEAITSWCDQAGILVNSNVDRTEISGHNLKSAACTVTIHYGRYEQKPEEMLEIFEDACAKLKEYRPVGTICPGNKQQNPLIRKYVLARENGTAVWAHPEAHMSRPGKNQSQINRAMLPVKARIALVNTTTLTGGWASTQGVEAQTDVQCFYPQVIQDPVLAQQYADDNGKSMEELETKMVHTWTGGTKQIWLTSAKEQIELGKFIDAKFSLKFMPAPLGGEVFDEDGNDIHFVIPISEIADKGSLYAMMCAGLEEKVIDITEVQDGVEQKTRVRALIIETTVYRSGSHSENTPAKRGGMTVNGFDRFALIKPLMDLGWNIPVPSLTNFMLLQSKINELEGVVANS